MTIDELCLIIQKRIKTLPPDSYVASLYKKGENAILQKIGEEATEVILAGKGKNKKRIIEETADLFFMILILIASNKISYKELLDEFEKRNNFKNKIIDKS